MVLPKIWKKLRINISGQTEQLWRARASVIVLEWVISQRWKHRPTIPALSWLSRRSTLSLSLT